MFLGLYFAVVNTMFYKVETPLHKFSECKLILTKVISPCLLDNLLACGMILGGTFLKQSGVYNHSY